LIRKD